MAKSILRLYNFNNYFNRIDKTAAPNIESAVFTLVATNFNPNDGIHAEHIFNLSSDTLSPDYMVEYDEQGTNIKSRWFIIEQKRTLSGQYKITLYRDLCADFDNEIMSSTFFIEKGWINDINDSRLFNKEDVSLSQIKQSETLLKDKTNSSWVVGYLASNALQSDVNISIPNPELPFELTVNGIENWEYYDYIYGQKIISQTGTPILKFEVVGRYFFTNFGDEYNVNLSFRHGETQASILATGLESQAVNLYDGLTFQYAKNANIILSAFRTANYSSLKSTINDIVTADNNGLDIKVIDQTQGAININELQSLNGKNIKDVNTNKIYKINVQGFSKTTTITKDLRSGESLVSYPNIKNNLVTLYNEVISYNPTIITSAKYPINVTNIGGYEIKYESICYSINLTEESNSAYSTVLKSTSRPLVDAPYFMFAIPYNDLTFYDETASTNVNCLGSLALPIANKIAEQFQANKFLYDLQLLPYCPIIERLKNVSGVEKLSLPLNDSSQGYSNFSKVIDSNNNIGTVIFWSRTSIFSTDITLSIDGGTTPLERKIINETKLYRLNSPNYSGAFDFNPAKNGGVDTFNVDCQYKPYNPYIHVNPNFKLMYGNDFNDARGLICGGDYSLPLNNDEFRTYEINNKNYNNSFERQIQNLEITQRYEKISDITNAVGNAITGVASGAVAGMQGGVAGAIVGGVVGGAASAVGGILDVSAKQALRDETKDYTQDMYAFNLGNIKALPNTLAKVSSYNPNNKVFPFLEVYSCSEQEEQALRDKITYNGMTINCIGVIQEYLSSSRTYVKGKLIRASEDLKNDFHLIEMIGEELNKGVFIDVSASNQ